MFPCSRRIPSTKTKRYQGWGLGEARGEICTGDGGEGGVEERYGGVDEERVAGDRTADRGVGGLEEGEAGGHGRKLASPSHADLEPQRHSPEH